MPIMADIEAMFHQVKVSSDDQDSLRFYWWPGGNLDTHPVAYKMVVHLFGAVSSSPSCCNLALKMTAVDNKQEFEEASDAVQSSFYVDDFLHSTDSEEKAITLIHDVTELCKKGGFRLTKWLSSSLTVLESIPEMERAQDVQKLTCDDDIATSRALGVYWFVESDVFSFSISVKNLPPTRRNLLSILSSVYDPLGLVSPVILKARIILQHVTKQNLPWDTEITGSQMTLWQNWLDDLEKLEMFTVPRCLKPSGFGDVVSTQLHYFSDASELGYGVVVYIHMINTRDEVHTQLLFSKARVAPLKKITIPRLELTAATMAVRINHKLCQELCCTVDESIYWTDSMTVLCYVANQTSRFQTFIANRLAIIHEGSQIKQWKYIDSKSNPADCVSRGMKADKLLAADWWIHGPDCIQMAKPDQCATDVVIELNHDDCE